MNVYEQMEAFETKVLDKFSGYEPPKAMMKEIRAIGKTLDMDFVRLQLYDKEGCKFLDIEIMGWDKKGQPEFKEHTIIFG